MKINCDGGARGNPGPAAAAFVVWDQAENLQFKRGKYLGKATNNEAEYWAVIEALSWLRENPAEILRQAQDDVTVNFFLDSRLVVNQLNGIFKIKEPRLRELLLKVRELEQSVGVAKVSYTDVPREQNVEADLLVNETLDQLAMEIS